jgi:putative ABC transport system ATP-binding protein
MTDSPNSILVFNQVSKSFPTNEGLVHALKSISFSLEKGKSLALTGPSGSGKSTLLNLAAGLEQPDSGTIALDSIVLAQQTEEALARIRNTRIGFIFQSFRLLGSLTAVENVEVPARLQGIPDSRERALTLLEQVGLSHRVTHYPSELSGGEQQRVAIARAFITRPPLLLADEPTGNLDFDTSETIKKLVFDLQKEHHSSILIVTHDLEFAARADTTINIRAGTLQH